MSAACRRFAGNLQVGQIVAFTNYLLTTMTPLIMMTMLSNTWADGIAAAKRIDGVLETVPDIQDDPHAQTLPATTPGQITFENVAFHYNGNTAEVVLDGINLVAEPGQTVAILGATGAGKSTLINLVPRFYDASGGRVLIDGQDVRQIQQDFAAGAHRDRAAGHRAVLGQRARQHPLWQPRLPADDEVIAAARAAQAHEFILGLPQRL